MTTPTPSIEERMAGLEGVYQQISLGLGRLEDDLRGLRAEMNALRTELAERANRLEGRIDGLEARMDRMFYWMLALMGGILASIVATVVARLA